MTTCANLVNRPWIDSNSAALFNSMRVIHIDLKAYIDADGNTWFSVLHTMGGRVLIARTMFDGALNVCEAIPVEAKPLMWTRETHQRFRFVHRRLLELARDFPHDERLDVLCHYVPRPDFEPWPRGMVNHWRYDRKK